jgi:hypothetical protein
VGGLYPYLLILVGRDNQVSARHIHWQSSLAHPGLHPALPSALHQGHLLPFGLIPHIQGQFDRAPRAMGVAVAVAEIFQVGHFFVPGVDGAEGNQAYVARVNNDNKA